MAIVNISLLLTSSSGLQNALQGVIAKGFTLTDYTDGTATPKISVGRTEEIAGALYRVETTDFTIDVTGVSGDGTYYIYVEDTGVSITAKALSTVPTWRGDLGGFYLSGSTTEKAVFRFVKSGSNYTLKTNLIQTVGYVPSSINADVIGNLTGNVTNNNSSVGSLPPIGSIIGLHPDIKTSLGLDTSIWSPCDGVASLPTANFNTTNDTKVPNLTDDRFLMGSTVYGRAGSNTINIEHNHTTFIFDYSGGNPRFKDGFGNELAYLDLSPTVVTQNIGFQSVDLNGTGGVMGYDDGFTYRMRTSNSLSLSQSILPLYFKVKYYIRIK